MGITYQKPFKAFRFLVEVESGGVAVAAFSEFSGVKMEVDTVQARSGNDNRGVQEYIPVLTRFAPVTLSKGVVGDNDFLDWLFSAAAGPETGPNGANLRRTLNIVALDDKGNRGVTWSLKDALPIGYELTPMSGGRSEVLSESLTFAITGMERITHEPPGEGKIGKVTRQAHARGDGDALKTFADRVHWSSSDSDIALSACCNCCARS